MAPAMTGKPRVSYLLKCLTRQQFSEHVDVKFALYYQSSWPSERHEMNITANRGMGPRCFFALLRRMRSNVICFTPVRSSVSSFQSSVAVQYLVQNPKPPKRNPCQKASSDELPLQQPLPSLTHSPIYAFWTLSARLQVQYSSLWPITSDALTTVGLENPQSGFTVGGGTELSSQCQPQSSCPGQQTAFWNLRSDIDLLSTDGAPDPYLGPL